MQSDIKIGIIQLSSNDSLEDNCKQLEYYFNQCLKSGAKFILTPEVSNFISNDENLRKSTLRTEKEDFMLQQVIKLCKNFKVWSLIGSLALKIKKNENNRYINRSILINPEGKIIARYNKIHMFDTHIDKEEKYLESKYFDPGNRLVLVKTPFANIGLTICYDLRFPYLFSKLKKFGADLICIPSAFTIKTGKDHWETLIRARALENKIHILAPAQCGQNTVSRNTWGHSLVVNPNGKILCDLGEKTGYSIINLKND